MTHPPLRDSRPLPLVAAAVLSTWLAQPGCNRPTPEPTPAARALADVPTTAARPTSPATPSPGATGAVEGVVRLTGNVPPSRPVVIDRDVERMRGCAESARAYYANPFGITAPGPLPEAIVTVDARGATAPAPRRRYVTYNDCNLEPRILAMSLDDVLVMHATTDAHHLTKVDGMGATIAQMLMPNEDQEKRLLHPGRYIIHSVLFPHWMQTPLVVTPNWFYDQTNREGHFRIEGLPVGTHTMHAWFPGAAPVDASVTVTANGTARQDFALSPLPPSELRPPTAPDAGPIIP